MIWWITDMFTYRHCEKGYIVTPGAYSLAVLIREISGNQLRRPQKCHSSGVMWLKPRALAAKHREESGSDQLHQHWQNSIDNSPKVKDSVDTTKAPCTRLTARRKRKHSVQGRGVFTSQSCCLTLTHQLMINMLINHPFTVLFFTCWTALMSYQLLWMLNVFFFFFSIMNSSCEDTVQSQSLTPGLSKQLNETVDHYVFLPSDWLDCALNRDVSSPRANSCTFPLQTERASNLVHSYCSPFLHHFMYS